MSWPMSHDMSRMSELLTFESYQLTCSYCFSLNSSLMACFRPLKPLDSSDDQSSIPHVTDSAGVCIPVTLLLLQRWDAQELFDGFLRIGCFDLLGVVVFVLDIDVGIVIIIVLVLVFEVVPDL